MEKAVEKATARTAVIERYKRYVGRKAIFILTASLCLVVFLIVAITLGSAKISFIDVLKALFGQGEPTHAQIIWRIRLPRVLSAILAGVALSLSGVAMQSVLRNPLGSPFTLGLSNAAAFGAAFAVVIFGAGSMHSTYTDAVIINNPYVVTLSSFGWCMVAAAVIVLVAKMRGANPQTMILMGIVLSSLFSAGITAIQYFSNEIQLAAIVFWTFGDLGRGDWIDFSILLAIVVPSLIFFLKNGWNYNALDAGDSIAHSLGVQASKVRIATMVVVSLLASVVIAFYGIIAYVGLVVPHIVRKIIGGEERALFIGTGIFGALFLLVADTVARTILSPIILPVGVLTSFLGAPMFIYLLLRGKRGGASS